MIGSKLARTATDLRHLECQAANVPSHRSLVPHAAPPAPGGDPTAPSLHLPHVPPARYRAAAAARTRAGRPSAGIPDVHPPSTGRLSAGDRAARSSPSAAPPPGSEVAGLRPLTRERRLAVLAVGCHGVITHAQLVSVGFSTSAVHRMLRGGRIRRVHRGVYVIGHAPLTDKGRLAAAALACGPGVAVSHRTAAELHGLLPWRGTEVHVTSPRKPPRHPGLIGHRSVALSAIDIVVLDGIPVTAVARTFADVAASANPRTLERMWRRAEELRVLDSRALMGEVRPGRPGAAAVRDLVTTADDRALTQLTRSELEVVFLEVVRTAGLPLPTTNHRLNVGSQVYEVDAVWPACRLVVELDGWDAHGTRRSFERDRLRDAALVRAGYRVVRFTWRRVLDDPAAVASTVRDLLSGRGTSSEPAG